MNRGFDQWVVWGAAVACLFGQAMPVNAEEGDQKAEGGALANPASAYELPTIEVISTAPLPGMVVPLEKVPSNVQTLNAKDIDGRGYDNLADTLNGALGNVNINDTQGNGYQVDVQVRGFTASPSLGTPEGVSVFLDGVRVNETFGDVVNWDLIPQNAIANITLMPGANPQFGLNTLGGALSVVTKSGFQFPGTQFDVTGGMFARRQIQVETGGHGENTDYFVAANWFKDRGWGDHNPSEVRQIFAKTGFQDDDTDIDLSFIGANNVLQGNQTLPLSMMGNDKQVYTYPDSVNNKLWMVNLKASQYLGKDWIISGNTYYRQVDTTIFNSNINGGDNFTTNTVSGYSGTCSTVDAVNCPDAANIINAISQKTYGLGLQLADNQKLLGLDNTAAIGLGLDQGRTDFTQSQQAAVLASDGGTFSNQPISLVTSLQGEANYQGIYATDTLSMSKTLAMTLSGRFNRANIKTTYLYSDDGYADNGDFTYSRFNPAIGFNFSPSKALTTYLSYTEGMRAPTPVELGCADPNHPCALPNAFSSDPYLKKVVSRSIEAGMRGEITKGLTWSMGLFQTRLQDDIQFISLSTTQGYFSNVGDTQRRGLELGVNQKGQRWDWAVNYSFIDATYQTAFTEMQPANSSADANGIIQVPVGARIPGIPQNNFKFSQRYRSGDQWALGWSMQAQSATYARGDENNQDVNGQVPGFVVFNLDGRYALSSSLDLSMHVKNIFDRRYSTYGVLATNYLDLGGHVFDTNGGTPEQFRSIGLPRTAWVTLTWWFDKPKGRSAGPDRD